MSRGAITNVWLLIETGQGCTDPDVTVYEDYEEARVAFEERIDALELDMISEAIALDSERYTLGDEGGGLWIQEAKHHARSTPEGR